MNEWMDERLKVEYGFAGRSDSFGPSIAHTVKYVGFTQPARQTGRQTDRQTDKEAAAIFVK